MNNSQLYKDIADINRWLDLSNKDMDWPADNAMRVLKLFEEAGEAARAYIGYTGQNPRKGFTHTRTEFLHEVADVAITALAAINHFTQDAVETEAIMQSKIEQIKIRYGITP